jgi:hypothetical protein
MTNFSRPFSWPLSRLQRDSGNRAQACLRACLTTGVAAALMLVALPALGASRAERYPERHLTVSHRVVHGRTVTDTPSAPRSSKPKAKTGHSSTARSAAKAKSVPKNATGSAKPAPRAKHRKLRPQDEADNDPVIMHRIRSRRGKLERSTLPRQSIATHSAPSLRGRSPATPHPADLTDLTDQEIAEAAALRKPATPETATDDLAVSADNSDGGRSNPDDDEHLLVSKPALDQVSAAPEPITPPGKPTLPEKLHAAATKAETAVKVDAASAKDALAGHPAPKPSIMPEDHAGRAAVVQDAMAPMVMPALYTRRGKLIVPPPMKGSWDILVHQNTMADSEGLDRIRDDDDLDRMRELHLLVPLQRSNALAVNEELPENRRYARPWTARFVADTARAFYSRFHQPLRLNSAVRTVEYQLRLQRVNGNAAAVDGDGASPHLTGQAIDLGKRGMSIAEIAWMRAYLAPLMRAGKLDVEEEFQQACFHISVYRSYMPITKARPKPAPKMEVAQLRSEPSVAKTRPAAKIDDGLR